MLIGSKPGKTDLARDKLAIVQCEGCRKERTVKFLSNYKKPEHYCRSCSTVKQLTGKKYSQEHCQAISKAIRKKGWRLASGYKQIIVDSPHPRAKKYKNGKYIMEHVLVMEAKIGRFLTEYEIVHHIDEDKRNNSPENLYLCSGRTAKETRQIHNNIHQTAEKLTIELLKLGLVNFKDGRYVMSEELERFAASIL